MSEESPESSRAGAVIAEFKIPNDDILRAELEEAGLPVLAYKTKWGLFRIQLSEATLVSNSKLIRRMIRMARDSYGGGKL